MIAQRKIIVYIATSADGYIARSDGNVDWLNRPRPAGDYGMGAFYKTIDTILWGRKTFGLGAEQGAGGFGSKIKNYVFTHHPLKSPVKVSNSWTNRSASLPGVFGPAPARIFG